MWTSGGECELVSVCVGDQDDAIYEFMDNIVLLWPKITLMELRNTSHLLHIFPTFRSDHIYNMVLFWPKKFDPGLQKLHWICKCFVCLIVYNFQRWILTQNLGFPFYWKQPILNFGQISTCSPAQTSSVDYFSFEIRVKHCCIVVETDASKILQRCVKNHIRQCILVL